MTPEQFSAQTAGILYQPRGVFFSELYLFTLTCRSAGVTAIVESGVGPGVSTRVLRALWSDVTSLETRCETIPNDLRTVVTVGRGQELVREWVTARPHQKLGVLLDGPKGHAGVMLRQWCLEQPQVRVVAQHDSPIGVGELFHSADPEFRRTTGEAIDARIDAAIRSCYQPQGCPGLGVWVNA